MGGALIAVDAAVTNCCSIFAAGQLEVASNGHQYRRRSKFGAKLARARLGHRTDDARPVDSDNIRQLSVCTLLEGAAWSPINNTYH